MKTLIENTVTNLEDKSFLLDLIDLPAESDTSFSRLAGLIHNSHDSNQITEQTYYQIFNIPVPISFTSIIHEDDINN